MKNFFILHGTGGFPYGNWFSWLAKELDKKYGVGCAYTPHLPYMAAQNYDNWSRILQAYVDCGLINKNTTFICHSSSCVFVTKFIIERKIKVKKLIFVSGFNQYKGRYPSIDKANQTLFTNHIAEVNNFCSDIVCFYSDNDQYLPFAELDIFAKNLGAQQIMIKNRGHFNGEVGCYAMPEILELL